MLISGVAVKKTFDWCHEVRALTCGVSKPELPRNHAHIVIRSVGAPFRNVRCGMLALYLEFHDLDDKSPGNYHAGLFKEEHALAIARFVRESTASFILVNCEAGISRSAGVVLALRRYYGGNTEEVFQKAIPNIYVANILSRVLNAKIPPEMDFTKEMYDKIRKSSGRIIDVPCKEDEDL